MRGLDSDAMPFRLGIVACKSARLATSCRFVESAMDDVFREYSLFLFLSDCSTDGLPIRHLTFHALGAVITDT